MIMLYNLPGMAKKETNDENVNMVENAEGSLSGPEEGKKKKRKKEPIQKSEEELYVETLSKEERRAYNRKKRALKRSQWVAEYWIIIILAVAVLVVFCLLMAIKHFDISAADFFTSSPINSLLKYLK